MAFPARFRLDQQLCFAEVDGASEGATLGESVWTLFSGPLRELLDAGFAQALLERKTLQLDTELPGAGLHTVTIQPVDHDLVVTLEPLADTEADGDTFFQLSADMLALLSLPLGGIERANPAWQQVLGYTPEALAQRSLFEFLPEEDRMDVTAALAQATAENTTIRFTCRFLAASGEFRHLQWSVAPSANGTAYAAARDITESRAAEIAIRRQVYRDTLTDLPNRPAIEEAITRLINGRTLGAFAVLFVDLDRFKPINDHLGHAVGDQALQIIARRLAANLRGDDLVGRLHGDEFVIVLPGVASEHDAHAVAQKVMQVVQQPFQLAGHDLRVTASIGVAVAPFHGTDAKTLLHNADIAMYQAKKSTHGSVAIYREGITLTTLEQIALESRLSQAVDHGEMLLHYQPQVQAASGQLVGFEALVRWRHHQLGMIPPTTFIPMAEETGLIVPLGHWIMGEACRQAVRWQEAVSGLSMAVNLSVRQFAERDLPQQIQEVLAMTGVDPTKLDLEFTESALKDHDETRVKDLLFRLKDLGVQLSVDDFGTGYTNFSRLMKLPVDRVKIDRSFVNEICQNPKDAALVHAIVDLSHTLGMQVIAEGVETHEQYEKLTSLGCDILQGYLFGKPLPPADIARVVPLLAPKG